MVECVEPLVYKGTAAMTPQVLVVEDNAATQVLLRSWLEFLGFTLLLAQNGEEALTQLETETPCVILLDLKMPSMDGDTLLEVVVQQPRLSVIPIIIITADVQAEKRLASTQVPIFLKPFKLNALLEAIKQYC